MNFSRFALAASLTLTSTLFALVGCGGTQRETETTPAPATEPESSNACPEGMHWDDCAHGSCPTCDDCVAECVAN